MNLILIAIIVVLGTTLGIVILDYDQTISSYESQLHDKLQVEDLIETFKEKYSNYDIMKFPDSKGVPYKYSVKTNYADVELIIEKDRVLLRAFDLPEGEPMCIVSNPIPSDILNNCPIKW